MQHTHRTMLEMEIGDVLALIDILLDQGVIDRNRLTLAIEAKKEKLKSWSKIYE